MSRFIQYLNLLGIVALTVLCCIQWRANRQLNLEVEDLEKVRLSQSTKIAEQEKAIKGYSADLDDFRQRLTLSEAALKDSQEQFKKLAAQFDQLSRERDQLKANLDQWMAAVAARDESLKQAAHEIEKLTAERNDAIAKFNDLASKYNALAKDLEKDKSKQ